ncbi:MAG: tetratricopeptide repeat protein [Massilia sp.]
MTRGWAPGLLLLAALAQAGLAGASDFDLGRRYRHGDGVPRDSGKAFSLIERAARNGDAAAMFTLSNMLEAGEGAPRDRGAARQWLEAAAENDFPAALQQLSLCLRDGSMGYAVDPARSAQLMLEAEHAIRHESAASTLRRHADAPER